jgi:hypothetical protein
MKVYFSVNVEIKKKVNFYVLCSSQYGPVLYAYYGSYQPNQL